MWCFRGEIFQQKTTTTTTTTHLFSQHARPLQAISPFPIHEAPGKNWHKASPTHHVTTTYPHLGKGKSSQTERDVIVPKIHTASMKKILELSSLVMTGKNHHLNSRYVDFNNYSFQESKSSEQLWNQKGPYRHNKLRQVIGLPSRFNL